MIKVENGRGFDEAVAGLNSIHQNLKNTAKKLRSAAENYKEAAEKIKSFSNEGNKS